MTVASAVLLALAGCAQTVPSPTGSPAISNAPASSTNLERDLALPSVGPGQPCPKSSGRVVSSGYGPALGAGPVYPVGLGAAGVLEVAKRAGQYLAKVLWVSSASYGGPIVIRGARLDQAGSVKFSLAAGVESDELHLEAATTVSPDQEPGWREWPSYTYVPEPSGCYGYQVDGIDFSAKIVFEVRHVS